MRWGRFVAVVVLAGTVSWPGTAEATTICSVPFVHDLLDLGLNVDPRFQNLAGLTGVVASSPNDAWVVGYGQGTFTAHWDGTTWHVVPSPSPGTHYRDVLNGVASLSPANAWAVGSATTLVPYSARPLIEHWDGRDWERVPGAPIFTPYAELDGVAAIAPNDVWAVGGWGGAPLVEHWNGDRWRTVSLPSGVTTELSSIVRVPGTDHLWAVGGQTAMFFDGRAWTAFPTPLQGTDVTLSGVSALSDDDAWAVGWQGAGQGAILHWDGTTWETVPYPYPPTVGQFTVALPFGVAAISSSDVWVVGDKELGDFDQGWTLHWNGNRWRVLNIQSLYEAAGPTLAAAAPVPGSSAVWAVGQGIVMAECDASTT